MDEWNKRPRISTAYQYQGIDASILENRHLRVMVLQGKGGDIVEFRDKRTDIDVLWHADHEWSAPPNALPSIEGTWDEYYPGGWQLNIPGAGGPFEFPGGRYDHHGETALLEWDAEIVRDDEDAVTLELTTSLRRYPFTVRRELTLRAGEAALEIEESITNEGDVTVEYAHQQHLTLGRPLIGPQARLDVSAERGYVEAYDPGTENHRLESEASFEWPVAPGADGESVDLSQFPPTDAEINDMAYLHELDEGWYAVTNPALDLGFGLRWPAEHFESLWYWQPYGGLAAAPFWGRNYTAGLEPTTAHPAHSYPDAQRENGSMRSLGPGETVEVSLVAQTFDGSQRVSRIGPDGTVQRDD
ncbi:aldose 1-epimerase [Halorhabdus sp. CBA1104]|uniref:aldose 1-epimerase n=1 Tax=unclassified Halorhabdus TaxID=2621901 RepID=UPI0012B40568|nr:MULTISPECIES: aldose 1-epimerase [unclassified Halorhabdus]QGN07180.1 aldose 1-epimerase [Halorhabdus sp. CBA1104]